MKAFLSAFALGGILASLAAAQPWQKVYPLDATPRDASLVGWDSLGRFFVWDNVASSGRGVYYLETGEWKHETLDTGLALVVFTSFAVAPNGTLYALGTVTSPLSAGVYRSSDLGKTWIRILDKADFNLDSPPPAVGPTGVVFVYARPSTSTSASGRLYFSADAGATWDSATGTGLTTGSLVRTCKQMTVGPGGLFLTCNSTDNANYRPWRLSGAGLGPYRITGEGVGGSCEYALSADVAGVVLMGCPNRTINMTWNGSDSLTLSSFQPNSGGEVTGLAARSNGEFFAGANNGGVFRTTDAGAAWTRAGAGMSGTDSATVRSMRKGPDGRIYATTGSGSVYVYGNTSPIVPGTAPRPRLRVTALPWGWLLRGTFAGERIVLRGTDGRVLRTLSANAGETNIPAANLPKAVLIAEIAGENPLFVKLPPR